MLLITTLSSLNRSKGRLQHLRATQFIKWVNIKRERMMDGKRGRETERHKERAREGERDRERERERELERER
jgi:hypothetical protein